MSYCTLATDNTLYLAGENHRCENPARYLIPGELGQYLFGATVCKQHLRYLIRYGGKWVESFKAAGIQKGQRILELQDLQRRQAIWSELS